MLTTIELRWFYPGSIPTEVAKWFDADCPGEHLGQPEHREDLYLYLPECEYLGIKLRQGKLEIKWRKAELGVLGFAQGLAGKGEKWAKWICEDPTEESFMLVEVVGKKQWLSVEKVRLQRQSQGCHVELTQMSIKSALWWSLGFEALVEDVSPASNFQVFTTLVLKTYPTSHLRAEDSFAYPTWLSLITAKHC